MITLVTKDRYIYDLEYRITDIIDEYQNTGTVNISTNSEGICLRRAKFYDLLDYACEKFNMDKKSIRIYTANQIEHHNEYNIIIVQISYLHLFNNINYNTNKNSEIKHAICLLGKINWNRTIIASWLYNNYRDKVILTFNYTHNDAEKLRTELDKINFYSGKDLEEAVLFLKNSPIVLDHKYDAYNQPNFSAQYDIIDSYNQVFLDAVAETYIMGNTFFPTEKTFRPIVAKTPFIVLGPSNYLVNMKKLGFKTFDHWWDESYDFYEGANRIIEIKKLLTEIMSWSQEQLRSILKEMQPILDHNYKIFQKEPHLKIDLS